MMRAPSAEPAKAPPTKFGHPFDFALSPSGLPSDEMRPFVNGSHSDRMFDISAYFMCMQSQRQNLRFVTVGYEMDW